MSWLEHPVTLPAWGLLCILAAAALAVTSLGWQTWQCWRWHYGAPDVEPVKWDGQPAAVDVDDVGERRERVS